VVEKREFVSVKLFCSNYRSLKTQPTVFFCASILDLQGVKSDGSVYKVVSSRRLYGVSVTISVSYILYNHAQRGVDSTLCSLSHTQCCDFVSRNPERCQIAGL